STSPRPSARPTRAARRAGQGPDERGAQAVGPPRSQRATRSAEVVASGISVSREGGPRRPAPTSAAGEQAARVFPTRNADAAPARGTWCPGRPRGDPVSDTGFGDTAGRSAERGADPRLGASLPRGEG